MEKLLNSILKALFFNNSAVCDGVYAVTTSDDDDLPQTGYFEVRGSAGNVKFDPAKGDGPVTLAFESGECSKFRAKKIYATDTTATDLVVYW